MTMTGDAGVVMLQLLGTGAERRAAGAYEIVSVHAAS